MLAIQSSVRRRSLRFSGQLGPTNNRCCVRRSRHGSRKRRHATPYRAEVRQAKPSRATAASITSQERTIIIIGNS